MMKIKVSLQIHFLCYVHHVVLLVIFVVVRIQAQHLLTRLRSFIAFNMQDLLLFIRSWNFLISVNAGNSV